MVSRDRINKDRHLTFQYNTFILKITKVEHILAKIICLRKRSTEKKFYFVDVFLQGSA